MTAAAAQDSGAGKLRFFPNQFDSDIFMMTRSEKINLTATIIGPIVIVAFLGWMEWSFNARLTIDSQAKDAFNAATYVPKTWYEKNQDETNRRLDSISSDVSKIQQDVATLRGEESGQYRNDTTHGSQKLMQGKE